MEKTANSSLLHGPNELVTQAKDIHQALWLTKGVMTAVSPSSVDNGLCRLTYPELLDPDAI